MTDMKLDEFQKRIEAIYFERDNARGVPGCFQWLAEEVGELAKALRGTDEANLREEFADCLAWLSTLASLKGVKLSEVVDKYAAGCPRCHATPCACS